MIICIFISLTIIHSARTNTIESTTSAVFETPSRSADIDDASATRCPCLPSHLCPSNAPPAEPDVVAVLGACSRLDHVRCCDVRTRTFIGMFAEPEGAVAERVLESGTETVAEVLQQLQEQQESVNGMTTDRLWPEIDELTENYEESTTEKEMEKTPLATTTATPETTSTTASSTTTTSTTTLAPTTIPPVVYTTPAPTTTTSTTPPTSSPSTTTVPSFHRKHSIYTDSKRMRSRFRPSSAAPPREIEMMAHIATASMPTRPMMHLTMPPPPPFVGMSSTSRAREEFKAALSKEKSARRMRLFNANNRVNVLQKNRRPEEPTEINATAQEPQTDAPTSTLPPVATTPAASPSARGTPAKPLRKITGVDREHRSMIEQVRTMLSLDAKRHPFVPIQSAYNTMLVATANVVHGSDVVQGRFNPPAEIALTTSTTTTTEPPATTRTASSAVSTSATSLAQQSRPFRGRQRFRMADLGEVMARKRVTTSAPPDGTATSTADWSASTASTTYQRVLRSRSRQSLRRARRIPSLDTATTTVDEYDEDGEYMLSKPPRPDIKIMFNTIPEIVMAATSTTPTTTTTEKPTIPSPPPPTESYLSSLASWLRFRPFWRQTDESPAVNNPATDDDYYYYREDVDPYAKWDAQKFVDSTLDDYSVDEVGVLPAEMMFA